MRVFCTNVWPTQRGGVVPAPLSRGGPKWRVNYPEGSDHSFAPNRLDNPNSRSAFQTGFIFHKNNMRIVKRIVPAIA